MSPRGVGVAEPLALAPALAEEALPVRAGGHVARVDSHVAPHVGKLGGKGSGHVVKASGKQGAFARSFTVKR
ncbi:MAG: hypothetical protein M3377_03165 [Actinomycetota bacterium]|nr:hypothetical protein [Actinomycetota bacterium]